MAKMIIRVLKFIFSTVGQVTLTLGLIIAGGKMFQEIEGQNEKEVLEKTSKAEFPLNFRKHVSFSLWVVD